MSIDASVDALAEALAANGVDPPRPPAEPYDLDAIDAELAPMSLPAELRRFWERVDPRSLAVWPFPHPNTPGSSLDSWKIQRDEFPGLAPRPLFDVASESHWCTSVELDSPLAVGGSIFDWYVVDGGFYLRYHELSGWLERIVELLVQGQFERREGWNGPVLALKDPHASLPLSKLPRPASPNPVHGVVTSYERHPLKWPLHWQRLSGIEPEEVKPRGATHSVAELLAADPSEPVEATIAGRVTSLWGSGSTWYPQVSDGSGSVVITCPGSVTALGPVIGGSFEFDVVADTGEVTARAIRPLRAE